LTHFTWPLLTPLVPPSSKIRCTHILATGALLREPNLSDLYWSRKEEFPMFPARGSEEEEAVGLYSLSAMRGKGNVTYSHLGKYRFHVL
jgi:hypothetical protein